MLEKPNFPDELIIRHLREAYSLSISQLAFLRLGADVNTAVYQAKTRDENSYFLKLRKGPFNPITVTLPQYLSKRGIHAIIPAMKARSGLGWADLGDYRSILYPFVEGKDGYEVKLTPQQWQEFGTALVKIHTVRLPEELAGQLPQEDYSPQWRNKTKKFQELAERETLNDPTGLKLAAFMRANQAKIDHLVTRSGQLAHELQAKHTPLVLCHSDLHPGNLRAGTDGHLYIVDWDNPVMAPKERDLMFSGGPGNSAFFQGYGPVKIDPVALAYYMYERIVVDIAEFAEAIFLKTVGEEDREQSYSYFTGQFEPGHEVDTAFRMDPQPSPGF